MMVMSRHYVLAAGGTGGHMIPAHALAEELLARGHRVALITDDRGARIPGLFDNAQVHILPAGRLSGGPVGWLKAVRSIATGRTMALRLYETFLPSAVIGFGGYPAFPALLAARRDRIPTLIHEQNAVLGRVNRLMAGKVDGIATAYKSVQRLPAKAADKVHLVGNPVRDSVLALRDQPFPVLTDDGVFRVLVTGGSQGASILSDVVPEGLALLPEHFRRRLQVTQQCRDEDIERVRDRYAALGIPADLSTYIPDLPERLGWSHLVIARAGASTIAELTAAGRPAILVPLPSATDDHQTYNAREMARAGGARMIAQPKFTAIELAKQMQKLGLEPAALAKAAGCARSAGRPAAAKDLADLIERTGRDPGMDPNFVRENVLRPIPANGAFA
jgi:UDP-N-acetylglucosamine--N-acetylmuramyl-(pentapeptide) pyrophosphoryl-undecaprenol N-acetylglucosamine transferase